MGFLENSGLSISDDYENLAPRKSFIDAKDFTSIEELAQYLIYLDKNEGTVDKIYTQMFCFFRK